MTVYLDNNATTQLDPRVFEAMRPYMQDIYGNGSSLHRYGRLIRSGIEQAREQLAQAVQAHPDQIIFTSSGTEANNLAIKGVAAAAPHKAAIAISSIEHPSVREPAFALRRQGWQINEIRVNAEGVVDLAAIQDDVITDQTRLVSVMSANNETGAIQPLSEIAEITRRNGAVLHTDATQSLGKNPIRFAGLGAQLLTLSAHKCHGPLGAGALLIDRGTVLQAQILGGDHERLMRAGTENVAAIVGFGKAAELAADELNERSEKVLLLRKQLEAELKQIPEVCIFAEGVERLPNTVQFGVAGCHGETLLLQLDRAGVAVSSGSACHSQVHEPSHVLTAMGVASELALTAVRVSLSQYTTNQDIAEFMQAFMKIVMEFRFTSVRAANAY